jgi:peptidoglycan/xylan/chitin deacetylase (PgdA/CDA1 family)
VRFALRRAVVPVALILALGAIAYAAYELLEDPHSQIFGRTLTQGPANQRVVALTYDDGPNPPYTGRILDVLEQEHVHATFFLVGRAAQAYPTLVQREARDGDALGNHTWDHGHLILMSRSQMRASLQRTDEAIYAAARTRTHLMRPPFGSRDWMVMQVARKMGYTVVMWSVPLAYDWEYPPPRVIAQRILAHVSDGAIIVLHDGNRGQLCSLKHLPAHVCDRSSDIEATRLIVDRLKSQGYRFVTIPQLMRLVESRKSVKHTPAPGSE